MNDSIVPSSIFLELPDGKYKQMTLFKVDEFKNKFDRFGNVTLRHYTICRKYYVFIFDYRMETEFGIKLRADIFVKIEQSKIDTEMELKDSILDFDTPIMTMIPRG